MITILNVLHLPWFAGTETAFVNYTKMLLELEYNVICLVPRKAEIIKHLPKNALIRIIEDNGVLLTRGGFRIFKILRLRKLLKSNQVNLVFAHSGGTIKLFKKVSFGICPVIGINHGSHVKHTVKADFAIAFTNKIKSIFLSLGMKEEQVFIIPNAIEIKELTNVQYSPPFSSNSEVRIGAMSRLSKEKDISSLVKACAILRDKNFKVKLIIAGDGNEREALKKEVNNLGLDNCVEFLGWIDDKQRFFSVINIFCLPSIYETFGLVLLEAMNYKCPIVATDADGPSEIIKHEITGLIARRNDPLDLANTLQKMILLPQIKRIHMTNEAANELQKNYSFAVVKHQLYQIIENLKLQS